MNPIRPCGKVIYSSLIIGIVIILGIDSHLTQGGVVEREKNIKELREDINLLNLINGLNLTHHQIRHILQYTEEVKSLKETYFNSSSTPAEMERTFIELKTVLEKNQGIPYDIERRTNNVNERGKEEMERFARDLKSIETKLDAVLLDSQKAVIEDFNPCLIPPKNLKNPVRVGQADDHSHGEAMLERLRKLHDTAFEMKKDEILEKHMENIEKHLGKMTDKEKDKEKERILAIVKEARAMSDVDFELNKTSLVEKIKPHDERKELATKLHKINETRRTELGKAGKYLLNERVVPLLEKRLEDMKKFSKATPVDLEKIETADICKRGACGLKE